MTITQALQSAAQILPRLDAEILLAHALSVSRTYLFSYPTLELPATIHLQFQELVRRAKQGEPIAYLTGEKEFWSQPLKVTPATLIPRADTETLIEIILQTFPDNTEMLLADLGTGSGAIAIAIAKEKPNWRIYATDKSADALAVAHDNAKRLQIDNITFCEGNWCQALPLQKFNIIVSNPPYLAKNDNEIAENVLKYEPLSALLSEEEGFKDLQDIAQQARQYLADDGFLLLEHGYKQADKLKEILVQQKYQDVRHYQDLNAHERATSAKKL